MTEQIRQLHLFGGPRGNHFKFNKCSKVKNGFSCKFTNTQVTKKRTIRWTLYVHFDRSGIRLPSGDRELGKTGIMGIQSETFSDGRTQQKCDEAYAIYKSQIDAAIAKQSKSPKRVKAPKPIRESETVKSSEKKRTKRIAIEPERILTAEQKMAVIVDRQRGMGPTGEQFELIKCSARPTKGEGIDCEYYKEQTIAAGTIEWTLYVHFDKDGKRFSGGDKEVGQFDGVSETFTGLDARTGANTQSKCNRAYQKYKSDVDAWITICLSEETECIGDEVVWKAKKTEQANAYRGYDDEYQDNDAFVFNAGYVNDAYYSGGGIDGGYESYDAILGSLFAVNILLFAMLFIVCAVCLGCIARYVYGKKKKTILNCDVVSVQQF